MPYRISRLGIVEIRSLDLDRDLDYYLNVLGLQLTAREGNTASAYRADSEAYNQSYGVGLRSVTKASHGGCSESAR